MSVLRVTFLSALVMELTATLSTAMIAVEVGIRLLYGRMAFEQAFFILILVLEFYLPLRLLGLRFHAGMAGAAAARHIYKVLDESLLQRKPNPLFQLLFLLSPFKGWIFLSILLGFLTVASGIGLMSTSTYIISMAAPHPSIAVLQVAIVGVRFFGITRALFRYLERIVSHQVTFKLMAQLRVWFFQALEPLAPSRLMMVHSGDLLNRIIGDISALENFYVRGAAPPVVAPLIGLSIALIMLQLSPWLSLLILIFMALGGIALPFWIWTAGQKPG